MLCQRPAKIKVIFGVPLVNQSIKYYLKRIDVSCVALIVS